MLSKPVIPHHFLIVAPTYSNRSGGVMILHELCDAINRSGHKASIVFVYNGSADGQEFNYAYSANQDFFHPEKNYFRLDQNLFGQQVSEILTSGTIIYPDLIKGNPLGARRVIRFVLNKNLDLDQSDYILSYSRVYCESYRFALPKMFLDREIHADGAQHWTKRNLNLTYVGKGINFENCFRIPGSILVERDWPRDKEQLGLLLRQCKFFFTWDCVSATNHDAVLCGAVPILMHDKQIPREDIDRMEFGIFPKINFQLDGLGGLKFDELDDAKINAIDSSLHAMSQNIALLESSWMARVGQFLNNYILYMHGASSLVKQ